MRQFKWSVILAGRLKWNICLLGGLYKLLLFVVSVEAWPQKSKGKKAKKNKRKFPNCLLKLTLTITGRKAAAASQLLANKSGGEKATKRAGHIPFQ